MSNFYPVILCGGSGTRLWPLSRKQHPKQFIKLTNDLTMVQNTIRRLPAKVQPPVFICNEEHRFIVAEQAREVSVEAKSILLEPVGRNTAPAIALAAITALKENPDAVLLVLASDHHIKDEDKFREVAQSAYELAMQDKLVTFGIVPTNPHTGYGYIKRGEALSPGASQYKVSEFVEKPDAATAKTYVDSGEYYWNSGMFVFKASKYLAELKAFRPDIYQACELAMQDVADDLDFTRVNKAAFEACPDESVDYAVMEHTEHAVVVPLDAGWSDVGSWSALWEESERDGNNNAIRGDVLTESTTNSYIQASNRLVSSIGLDNIVIIDTPDALLVADKDQVQNVKGIVDKLKGLERSEYIHHREVYRPWGKYDSVDNGSRFQVKRITVKPGAKLSVQMHHHRAEHWIVVSGTAKVRNGDKEFILTENESTYIPIGAVHSLENPGKLPLELIEVQSGSYLGEDDIVRLADKYGRSAN
ncbi:mannose-1-phosphate guanylyltransferase/mannose-6-phosphate isomerase [Thalassomonas viridans]|uniref:mannose-1-phosphate guanylyltransferase n=1 Tax=Thalassomonas viridans TaxID=137584 RepID=A0AAE9Z1D1_9GAMM|nr:mannose-1-phosphate guanylyltransferase/mannose-6-phosphate isomerase [Thalassomonas viridans]WDE05021.1 mannose-1-phosphate guanylyltransferase/mannose-6-phosphate isomerase [Thalassomonas viridans]